MVSWLVGGGLVFSVFLEQGVCALQQRARVCRGHGDGLDLLRALCQPVQPGAEVCQPALELLPGRARTDQWCQWMRTSKAKPAVSLEPGAPRRAMATNAPREQSVRHGDDLVAQGLGQLAEACPALRQSALKGCGALWSKVVHQGLAGLRQRHELCLVRAHILLEYLSTEQSFHSGPGSRSSSLVQVLPGDKFMLLVSMHSLVAILIIMLYF